MTTHVSSSDLAHLAILAGGAQDELSKYEGAGLNEGIRAAIARKRLKAEEEAAEQAAERILMILQSTDKEMAASVQRLRDIRRRETAELNNIKKLELAKIYALETSNFIPLVVALNGGLNFSSEEHRKLSVIPEGWQPKLVEVAVT